jgi:hypothetical protein
MNWKFNIEDDSGDLVALTADGVEVGRWKKEGKLETPALTTQGISLPTTSKPDPNSNQVGLYYDGSNIRKVQPNGAESVFGVYSDSDAISAINSDLDHGSMANHNYFSGSPSDLSQDGAGTGEILEWNGSQWSPTSGSGGYTDSDAINAINTDTDHGSTASHNYFSGSPSSLNQDGAGTGDILEWDGSQWSTTSGSGGYTDTDARDAINTDTDHGSTANHNYFSGFPSDLNQDSAGTGDILEWDGSQWSPTSGSGGYTDSDAINAINTDTDHGSTASHNYFSGSPSDLNQDGATTEQTLEWDVNNWVSKPHRTRVAESIGLDASGTGNNTYRIPVYLRDGWRVDWLWGSLSLSDGSTDTGIYIEEVDWNGTIGENMNLVSDPMIVKKKDDAALINNTGSPQRAYFRVENNSSTAYTADSAAADAVEFEIEYAILR